MKDNLKNSFGDDKSINKSFFKDSNNDFSINLRSKSNNKINKYKRNYVSRFNSPISKFKENNKILINNEEEYNNIIIDYNNLRSNNFEIKRVFNEININTNMKKMVINIENYLNKTKKKLNNIKNGILINSKSNEIESSVLLNKLSYNRKTLDYLKNKKFDLAVINDSHEYKKFEKEERNSIINSYKKKKKSIDLVNN